MDFAKRFNCFARAKDIWTILRSESFYDALNAYLSMRKISIWLQMKVIFTQNFAFLHNFLIDETFVDKRMLLVSEF